MKGCPDCGTRNQQTNLFCPTCGHAFFDDRDERGGRPSGARKRQDGRAGGLSMTLAVVFVVMLALIAGFTSFLVSREIELGRLVTVRAGTVWRCSKCGRDYRDRVMTFSVPRSEKERYAVDTVAGECYSCRYGEFTGRFEEYLERFSRRGYFMGHTAEMDTASAGFMSANQGLFPAASAREAADAAKEIDPRLLESDYRSCAGKPVGIEGRVVSVEVVEVKGGGEKLTYLVIAPRLEGRELDQEIAVIYPGVSGLLRGDAAKCYMLPLDLVRYSTPAGERRAVLAAGIHLSEARAGR